MLDFSTDAIRTHAVRLFPTVRIGSDREAELRATAALCAMVKAVSEFGRSFIRMAGGPAGRVSCYTEVCLPSVDPEAPELRPDALIRVVRGQTEWTAMVEVKVGDNPLLQSQVDDYHRVAKDAGCSALVTISNQTARSDGLPPLSVDGRRLRSVPVHHVSWDRLLSEARMLTQTKAVMDQDQQWMLNEWIRYVADPTSRIIAPASLGDHWNDLLQAARQGNLVAAARFGPETVQHWESFLKKLALRLRAQLGADVDRRLVRADRKDPDGFLKRSGDELLRTGTLNGLFRVQGAAGDIAVHTALQARTVRYGVGIVPPSEGRMQTRVNWLLRQLVGEGLPSELVVRVDWNQGKLTSFGKLSDVRADGTRLLRDPHNRPIPPTAVPRRFTIEWTRGLAKGRGRSTAPVLDAIAADFERFYRHVVERLVPFVPKAPRLPVEAAERAQAVHTVRPAVTANSTTADDGEPRLDEAVITRAPEKVDASG